MSLEDLASAEEATRIRESFARAFAPIGAELPESIDVRGSFGHGDWWFRYVVNVADDGRPCLDVVAQVAGTEQVERFLASGELESGPNFADMVILDPDVDDDFDAAERRVAAHNAHVGEVMRARGLL